MIAITTSSSIRVKFAIACFRRQTASADGAAEVGCRKRFIVLRLLYQVGWTFESK